MQNANTLYYSIAQQKCNKAVYVLFSFSNPLYSNKSTVTQRSAHSYATMLAKHVTSASIAALVTKQQALNRAANAQACFNNYAEKLLLKNDSAAAAL